ncbi:hypothetical protein KR054_001720, partial [Drosophila jambulina]
MFSTPQRRNGSEGPLYHSTPRSEVLEESEPVGHVTSLAVSTHGWYRVLVFSKDHLGVNRILRRIRQKLRPLKLELHYLHSGGESDAAEDAGALFTFYVNGYAVASALFRLGKVNSRLWVRVNQRMPVVQYDAAHRKALRQAILARYDRRHRSLNLTLFHHDGILQGVFFALANPHCMSTVLWILAREMPDLRDLKLDRNHLSTLMPFWHVERRLPGLQSISLENNDLNSLALLQALEFLPLVELNLKRNLLPPGYEIDVLYMWPSLQKLNGVSVPP